MPEDVSAEDRENALNAGLNGQEPPAPAEEEPAPAEPETPAEEAPAEEVDVDAEEPEQAAAPSKPERSERPESRYERRVRSLAERTAKAEAEATFAREMAERYRREVEQAAAVQRQREDEMLDPSERRMRDTEHMARSAHMAAIDAADRATFIAQSASDPMRAKYQTRVEAELSKARSAGQMATREGIYIYLRGQDSIAAEARGGEARRKSVEAVRQERGKPASPKSDATPSRAKSLEDRLKDIAI